MSKMIGVSPTYLSKIERDEFPPPAEDKIMAIAEILNLDADELLALAGKISSDLTKIIKERPHEFAQLLRGTVAMSGEEKSKAIARMIEAMKERNIPPFVEE